MAKRNWKSIINNDISRFSENLAIVFFREDNINESNRIVINLGEYLILKDEGSFLKKSPAEEEIPNKISEIINENFLFFEFEKDGYIYFKTIGKEKFSLERFSKSDSTKSWKRLEKFQSVNTGQTCVVYTKIIYGKNSFDKSRDFSYIKVIYEEKKDFSTDDFQNNFETKEKIFLQTKTQDQLEAYKRENQNKKRLKTIYKW